MAKSMGVTTNTTTEGLLSEEGLATHGRELLAETNSGLSCTSPWSLYSGLVELCTRAPLLKKS